MHRGIGADKVASIALSQSEVLDALCREVCCSPHRLFLCLLCLFVAGLFCVICEICGSISSSKRNQLSRRVPSFLLFESLDKDARARCWKFVCVGAVDQLLQSLAACEDGPHLNLLAVDFDDPARFLAQRAIPASFLQAIRANEHASFDDDGPDADDAVRLRAGANAEDLRVVNRFND